MTSAHRSYLIAAVAIGWAALALQLHLSLELAEANGMAAAQALTRAFSYFTVLTNTLVAAVLTLTLIGGRLKPNLAVMSATAVYIAIVGIVYSLLLRSLWDPEGLQKLADSALHDVMPVLFVLYWMFFTPKEKLPWFAPVWWLIYPALYLAFVLVNGALTGWYPYPFVDVSVLGYGAVARNCAGLFCVFLGLGFAFAGIAKWRASELRTSKA